MLSNAPSKMAESEAKQIGFATKLLFRTSRTQYPIRSLEFWVLPAITLRQIRFFFDVDGSPLAYITWAFLTDEASERMSRDQINLLHLSEWNEGLNLWIVDLVAPYGHAAQVARLARDQIFADISRARCISRDALDELKRIRVFKRAGGVGRRGASDNR